MVVIKLPLLLITAEVHGRLHVNGARQGAWETFVMLKSTWTSSPSG